MKFTALLMILSIALCGCVTMNYPRAYKVEGKEFREFKELDDDKALKIVAMIYNVRHADWEGTMARNITLDEYINLLRKRRSLYIKKSGIFNIKYEKQKLSKWKKEELERLYDLLEPKTQNYYIETANALTEGQNAIRITYLTAMGCVVRELERRQNTDAVIGTAMQVIITALSVALQML